MSLQGNHGIRRTTNLMDSEIREQRLRLVVRHRWVNDHVVTLVPVDRSCNTMLVAQLKGINHSDDLVLRNTYLVQLHDMVISRPTKLRPVEAG